LVAAVGVASGNISRSLRPEELRPKDQKKTQNSKGKQIRSVVCLKRERVRERERFGLDGPNAGIWSQTLSEDARALTTAREEASRARSEYQG
jgi:hypothetical protein